MAAGSDIHANDGSINTSTNLPRLRFSRGERKKPAPKLNMDIPMEQPAPSLNIFNATNLPKLPPMPKQFKNKSTQPNESLSLNLSDNSQTNVVVPMLSTNSNPNLNVLTAEVGNSLPSAATTLTTSSFSTLNDDNPLSAKTSSLISSFNNTLKLDENDDVVCNLSDSYNNNTPTDESIKNNSNNENENENENKAYEDSMRMLLDKGIDDLTETDWKILHEKQLIKTVDILGEGNGGSVKKCQTLTKNPAIFALKIITTDPTPEFQKQMVRELNYNRKFNSQYIVKYYGTFLDESSSSIHICMEYMGGRSLDAIYKAFKERDGRLSEKPLGKIACSVLKGLAYLNESKVMHRDIKPQNILLNSNGDVKLCDFGVSGDVVNSLASTYIGTSFYMAPERIKNEPYTISCDVWSVGLTVLEGALGEFPFIRESSPDLQISPLELLIMILEFEPILEDEPEEGIKWSKGFKDFIKVCLTKEGRQRPSPRQMLEHPWLVKMANKNVRMDKLVEFCWG